MSITSDIRAKADAALEQGRTQLTNAQSQLAGVTEDVTGRVNGLAAKATETVGDLRTQAEKAINFDAIKSAVEPYLAQAKEYRNVVTDRASSLVDSVTGDKRVAKVLDSAESISGAVVETVTVRVVKPVQGLARRGKASTVSTPRTRTARKSPAKSTAAKAASTRPAPKPAAKQTARKSPAKSTAAKAASTEA